MNYGTHPTGRENVALTYCSQCSWHKEIKGAFVNDCPDCKKHGLSWLRYERGAEEEDVRKIIPSFPPQVDLVD